VFLLGLFGKKATARGALTGIAFGVAAALVHLALAASGRIDYGSMMSANFYIAMVAFTVAIIAGLAFSSSTGRKSDAELDLLVYRRKGAGALAPPSLLWWTLAATLVCACALLNFWWR
jgi:SSS family solute:Na+ symporter